MWIFIFHIYIYMCKHYSHFYQFFEMWIYFNIHAVSNFTIIVIENAVNKRGDAVTADDITSM